jgi:hypothetical protein
MQILGRGVNNRIGDKFGFISSFATRIVLNVIATLNGINPFSATSAPPSGYQFIVGPVTININAKEGTFGVSSTVAATITAQGVVTETTSGQVQTALQNAGWTEGDEVLITVSGATYDVYVSPGPVAALTSVSRVGIPTNSFVIAHPSMAVTTAPRDLVAFYWYRGINNISTNQFTFNGATMTQVATAVNVQTSGWTGARRLVNPNNVTIGDISMTGLSSSANNASTMVLLSIDNSDLFNMTTATPAGSVTAADVTVSVLPGDVLVSIVSCFGAAGPLGTVTWTGTSEISASAQCGSQISYSAVAMQTITATNAAYVVGASWAAARSNCTHSVLRIRKV